MIASFSGLLFLIVVASLGMHFWVSLRTLRAVELNSGAISRNLAGRYLPMLRLLADGDLQLLSTNQALLKKVRAERRRLFRTYLGYLTKDYARLLGGLRLAMVQSGVDRPDLAKALARNRMLFTMVVCKVQYRLALHALGIGKVDVSGLVAAFDAMRTQVAAFQSVSIPSAA
jgi:hypothetical protein